MLAGSLNWDPYASIWICIPRNHIRIQLTAELVGALDRRAATAGRSRSDLIREAIESYLAGAAADEIDRRIVAGYRSLPQEDGPWAEALAKESIAAEPW